MSTVPDPQPTGKYVYVIRASDDDIVTIFEDEGQANGWVAAEREAGNTAAALWRVEKYHIERWTP